MQTTSKRKVCRSSRLGSWALVPVCGRTLLNYSLLILSLCSVLIEQGAANTGDFSAPADGKADLLWQNSATTGCKVWFLNGRSKIAEQPIREGGSQKYPGAGWRVVGVGNFSSPQSPQLGILFQHDPSSILMVWHMSLADPTVYASTALIDPIPDAGWKARAVGDFDGDRMADIAWENESLAMKAVWLMNGTAFRSASYIDWTSGPNWHITAAGDMGRPSNPGDGSDRDGKDDIILT